MCVHMYVRMLCLCVHACVHACGAHVCVRMHVYKWMFALNSHPEVINDNVN